MATHEVELPPPPVAGQIEQYRYSKDIQWPQIYAEFIDNALDAHATRIEFTLDGATLAVVDNGLGCADPKHMVGFGETMVHDEVDRKAGRYGLGCKLACIRASQRTDVTIISIHGGFERRLVADWGEMIVKNKFYVNEDDPIKTKKPPGVCLFISNCTWFPPDHRLQRQLAELGWKYMDSIEQGTQIIFNARGKTHEVRPYVVPDASQRHEFAFDWEGHPVTGFCILVKQGTRNDHPGWSIHWGPHRILGCFEDPAAGNDTSRLQGHVYIPETYRAINVTKDGFADDPIELWQLIHDECVEIIEKSETESHVHDTQVLSDRVSAMLNESMVGQNTCKGSRPSQAGKKGTVTPTNNGAPHKQFAKRQPGDKAPDPEVSAKEPEQFRVRFDPTMEEPWRVNATGNKLVIRGKRPRDAKPIATIYLGKRHPAIRYFIEKKDAKATFAFCCAILSLHYAVDPESRPMMNPTMEKDIKEAFQTLAGKPEPIEAAMEATANA